jgi:uncharacterized YigZ family protein
METRDTYQSISSETKAVFRDKASKFIAFAIPVSDEDEVKHNLDRLRKEYYDANHHCYAFRLGIDGGVYRLNDDGEPSGSAGRPIFGQILSSEISDVLVVVVRYFGGTKLGVPGLIHAYKTVSREALDQAVIIEKTVLAHYEVRFPYGRINDVMRILKDDGITMENQEFDNNCTIHFRVRISKAAMIKSRLTNINDLSIFIHT